MKKVVRLDHLNTKSFLEGKFDTAIVPLGSCESHGDHLPFGTDALTAHAIGVAVAEKMERVVVLPPTPFGMSGLYQHKPMTITLSDETNIAVIRDILESLAHWGIRNVFIMNGHDGNIPCIEIAARNCRLVHPDMNIMSLEAWWYAIAKLLPPNFFDVWNGLGHGGEGETSISLALFPELCHMEHARGMIPELDDFIREVWKFGEITDEGATGAPGKATREKGEKMRDILVERIVKSLSRMQEEGLRYNPKKA